MRNVNSKRGSSRAGVVLTVVLGGGVAGAIAYNSVDTELKAASPAGVSASAVAEPSKGLAIEDDWRHLSDTLGFEFAILDYESAQAEPLRASASGAEVMLSWLQEAFPSEAFMATTDDVKTENGITTWKGSLRDERFGYAIFCFSADGVAGFVQRDTTAYVIEPLVDRKMVITEIYHPQLPQTPAPPQPSASAGQAILATNVGEVPGLEGVAAVTAGMSTELAGDAPIDLLLLLPETSPRAESYCAGPTQALVEQLMAARLEDCFNASCDPRWDSDVRFRVTIASVDYVPEGGTLNEDLKWVQTEQVAALRDNAKADLVGLLIDGAKQKATAGGMATAGAIDSTHAFIAVDIHSALAHYAVEHEIGHCMGMLHDVGEGEAGDCNYGHMLPGPPGTDMVAYTIMMGGHKSNAPRIPVFSHPAADPATGLPLGLPCSESYEPNQADPFGKFTTAPANNRLQILENAATISRYR